jgi:hypothetical protein
MPDLLPPAKSLVLCLLATACGAITPSPPATARLRVAHVSPGAPAVDFCLARHGTTRFAGPILAGAGRAAGLSYATVTRYFDVDAARYDVRLVAPGAASCEQPLAGLDDFTRLPELAPGASGTGGGAVFSPVFSAVAFGDAATVKLTPPAAGLLDLRDQAGLALLLEPVAVALDQDGVAVVEQAVEDGGG